MFRCLSQSCGLDWALGGNPLQDFLSGTWLHSSSPPTHRPTHPTHCYDNLVLDVFGKHGNSFIDGLVASVVHKHSANRHRLDWGFVFFVILSQFLKWMLMQFAAMCSHSSHRKQSVSCGRAPLCVEEVGDVSPSALLLVSNKHEPFFWLFFPPSYDDT